MNKLKQKENESKELGYTMDGVRVYLGVALIVSKP